MEGGREANNNKSMVRRGLEDEDSSFSSMRSSLRARRDRLARKEARESKEKSPVPAPADVPDSPETRSHPISNFTRNSSTRRSRLAHEYSEPQVDTNDDETALSLISSSKILSMDDSSIRSTRGLSGEGSTMHGLRKSLPSSTRTRRARKDLSMEDTRNRKLSREIIHRDINGLLDTTAASQSKPLVNGSSSQTDVTDSRVSNGHDSEAAVEGSRSLLDETTPRAVRSYNRSRSNSDFTSTRAAADEMDKPVVERTTSGSTIVSGSGAIPGETREERIARYKEMRKAALAARTSQYLDSGAEDNASPVSGYVPRYLRNRDGGGSSVDRNRDDDAGSGYIPRWRRRNNNEDNDMASSSNASSMTDLHVTRKDSSASSENSGENGHCKLTYENLKLHDKLSSASPPYSSLSRLEEGAQIAPITGDTCGSSQANNPDHHQYSRRKESTNEITPTNSPALATKANRTTADNTRNSTDKPARRKSTDKDSSSAVAKVKSANISVSRSEMNISNVTSAKEENGRATMGDEVSKARAAISDGSEHRRSFTSLKMDEPVGRRSSVGLSDRLKKFESSSTSDISSAKTPAKPGKLDTSRFITRSTTNDVNAQPAQRSEVRRLHNSFSPSNTSIHKSEDKEGIKATKTEIQGEEVGERRKVHSLHNKDSRPVSVASEEPLLDPQLAAMLEARKIKAGETPVERATENKQEGTDVTSILKSRMRKRDDIDGKKSTISVSARASFFKDEQQRVAETPPHKPLEHRPHLDRHPSAKMPRVDKQDVEAHHAIGAKRAVLMKKRRKRSATQPITLHDFIAAKTFDQEKQDKTQDEVDSPAARPFRGRLLSVPTTSREIHQVKIGAPPQKYIRPKEKKEQKPEKIQKKSKSRPVGMKNVSSKVDSGRSVLSRNSVGRSSVRGVRDEAKNKASTAALSDAKSPEEPNKFSRRSASVRATSSSTSSVKAAAERAHALVESRKLSPTKKTPGKVGEAIRAKATAKVDSRRASSHTQINGSAKKLNIKVTDNQGSSGTPESCPLSPASSISTTDRANIEFHSHRNFGLTSGASEDVPNYMRVTTASMQRERATPTSIIDSGDEHAHQPTKKKTSSHRELDITAQPSYMKPTNSVSIISFAHRLEAKLDDLSSPTEASEPKSKSKAISLLEQERGEPPSFMKPTASYMRSKRHSTGTISTNRLEKIEGEEGKHRARRPISPTLPDGDLPSYMKATESYFKKVEHLFDEEPEEPPKSNKRVSLPRTLNDDELPSFMKPTKAFDAQVSVGVEEPVPESKPKRKLPLVDHTTGEVPSYMKSTTAYEKRVEEEGRSETGHTSLSNEHSSTDGLEKRTSVAHNLSNGEMPSFMKPTKSFEIRDRHNEEAQSQFEESTEPEKKVSAPRKPRVSLTSGEVPSYMKTTKSHEIREHAIATGVVETTSLERALQGPMIDEIPEPVPAKPRKTSVGGFLRKKFGIGKGTSVDSAQSSGAVANKPNKKSNTKSVPSKAPVISSQPNDIPSYMKPTTNSSRKISESGAEETDDSMSSTTLTSPSVHEKTPIINISQVSIDGQDMDVAMRPKKTPSRTKNSEDINANTPPRSTIANRSASVRVRGTKAQSLLASLQVNGEEGWKRRIGEKDHGSFRSGSIHDRLSKIEDSSKSWQKNKGIENDAKQFTVEGKMAKKGDLKVAASPLMPRKEKAGGAVKRAQSLRIKREDGKTPPKSPVKKSQSTLATSKAETPKVTETAVVRVPEQDDAAEFFALSSTQEDIDVSADDFDHIFMDSGKVLSSITKIKPKRNKPSSSPNPYKALQMRQDIKSEYTERKSDIADIEMKRLNKHQVAERASRTAMAGLATKEDINRVALKKTNRAQVMNPGGSMAAPYSSLMLMQVKGRRHVEMRLVQPTAKSINSGDCFLLVTKNKIFQWMGELANVMERSKAADLATYIMAKKDIGCTMAKTVTVLEENKRHAPSANEFWKLLGGTASYNGAGPLEEDELYEDYLADTNSIYSVHGDNLTPVEEYCGQIPRYDMLDDEKVLVFDFGTEVYAWCGKLTSMEQRKSGLRLAKMLFQSGYDYSECDINPMSPLHLPEAGGLPKKANTRPDWAICGKVTANMETILFKEKFYDWPEKSRLIQTKDPGNSGSATPAEELKPYDAKLMLERVERPVTLVLEHSNVGRGTHWVEYDDGLKKEQTIETLGLRMWHVSASEYYELTEDSYGQLHSSDTYVVRWQYQVKQSGVRNLKGNLSKHQAQMGRERCAYFFWQGAQSTINEKGASALMTVELDEEHGPQVRVEQGLEPAAFLSLFQGHMITHLGKRDDDAKKTSMKLYVVQHEHKNETSLHEVPCHIKSLRSCGVFIYLNIKTEVLQLWFGSQASQSMKKNGKRIADWVVETCPMEMGLSLESSIRISEVMEGRESMEFFTALRSSDRTKYNSQLKVASTSQDYVARMFSMSSVNLTFHVQEVFLPARNEQYSAFPFAQCQLYKQQQPALMLLDFGDEVYLWHGWWPVGFHEEENMSTGSARSRFTCDRKLAMKTAINYCKARGGTTPQMYCVYAGAEPLLFTTHFPLWEVHEEAAQANSLENRSSSLEHMSDCFARLSKSVYTFEELQERPLPDGVNPNKLETYLSDDEFSNILKMSREEFASLPSWKQTNIRKESNLF
ncbi:supervillin-like [Watersipora subatra]|uniref:supervillin-like n=1 Tax=Watersipora subatra TaxID=2589382 RepID=UPI00355B6230